MGRLTAWTLNERAWALADAIEKAASPLGVSLSRLETGTRVIDAGIHTAGGLGAGLALARLCMGGLGHVVLTNMIVGGAPRRAVHVWTDHPSIACMASQYAGWAIAPDGYFAMGSGPLRAIARVERELFERLRYEERGNRGVLVLEGRTPPTAAVARWIAEKAAIASDQLTLVIAPTASLAGGVQVVARSVETGLHKMDALGFDVTRIIRASGTAPLPPVARSDVRAIGRTNDCVLYGAQVRFTVDADDEELSALVNRVPSSVSRDYGTPFFKIFEHYDRDFYKIDPLLFSPAEVWLTSIRTGCTFHGGALNPDVLSTSLFGDD